MIDDIQRAFCPTVMVTYALIGAWLVKLSVEKKQQLLFLVGLWAWIVAAQILAQSAPSILTQLPYIGSDFVESQSVADTLFQFLSFGATICIGWAGVLALQGKFCIHEPGSFIDWIAGSAAISALVLAPEHGFCKTLDTATSVVAAMLMSVGLLHCGKFTPETRYFSWLRWTGGVLWCVHALVDIFWYIVDDHLFAHLSESEKLIINVVGTLPPLAAAIITGLIFRNVGPQHNDAFIARRSTKPRRRSRSRLVAH